MNRIYKTIWNESIRAWVAVHENAAACGKSTRSTRGRVARGLLALGVAATGFTAATPGAHAQTVVSGGANNASSGKTASVDQSCGQNFVDRSNPGNTANGNTYMLTNGCSTAVGNNASAQTAGVALGDRASAAPGGVALGVGARAVLGNSGVAIGPVALSSGNTSIAIGRQSAANGDYSMALGNVAYAKGESGIALGHSALADGYRSIAIGASDSRAAGNDAVNVNQLMAVSDSAAKYDTNPDGPVNYGSVMLNPGGSEAKLDNVAAGDVSATSRDAVNGSQLHQTNQMVNTQGDSKRVSYGARAITAGGLLSLPKTVFPGGALIGDDAGFLNASRIKGSHAAIKTGMLAADAAFDALQAGRQSDELNAYPDAFKQSWLHTELYRARYFKQWMAKGLYLISASAMARAPALIAPI